MGFERSGVTPRHVRDGEGEVRPEGFRVHARVFGVPVMVLASGPHSISQAFVGDGAGEVGCWAEITTAPSPAEAAARLGTFSREQWAAIVDARPVAPGPVLTTFFPVLRTNVVAKGSVRPLVLPAAIARCILDGGGVPQCERVEGKCSPALLRRTIMRAREAFPMVPDWVSEAYSWSRETIDDAFAELDELAQAVQDANVPTVGWA